MVDTKRQRLDRRRDGDTRRAEVWQIRTGVPDDAVRAIALYNRLGEQRSAGNLARD